MRYEDVVTARLLSLHTRRLRCVAEVREIDLNRSQTVLLASWAMTVAIYLYELATGAVHPSSTAVSMVVTASTSWLQVTFDLTSAVACHCRAARTVRSCFQSSRMNLHTFWWRTLQDPCALHRLRSFSMDCFVYWLASQFTSCGCVPCSSLAHTHKETVRHDHVRITQRSSIRCPGSHHQACPSERKNITWTRSTYAALLHTAVGKGHPVRARGVHPRSFILAWVINVAGILVRQCDVLLGWTSDTRNVHVDGSCKTRIVKASSIKPKRTWVHRAVKVMYLSLASRYWVSLTHHERFIFGRRIRLYLDIQSKSHSSQQDLNEHSSDDGWSWRFWRSWKHNSFETRWSRLSSRKLFFFCAFCFVCNISWLMLTRWTRVWQRLDITYETFERWVWI